MIYKHWMGTDSLKLVTYPSGKLIWKVRIFAERLLWRLFEPLIDKHFVVHPRLSKHLIDFGISKEKISVKVNMSQCTYCLNQCERIEHEGIYIAYYYPGDRGNRRFKQWVYGLDIIERVIPMFPDIKFILLDGKQKMCSIYPTLDAYIRPTRHDGFPRIVIECLILDIPYYWDEEFQPSVSKLCAFLEKVVK